MLRVERKEAKHNKHVYIDLSLTISHREQQLAGSVEHVDL